MIEQRLAFLNDCYRRAIPSYEGFNQMRYYMGILPKVAIEYYYL